MSSEDLGCCNNSTTGITQSLLSSICLFLFLFLRQWPQNRGNCAAVCTWLAARKYISSAFGIRCILSVTVSEEVHPREVRTIKSQHSYDTNAAFNHDSHLVTLAVSVRLTPGALIVKIPGDPNVTAVKNHCVSFMIQVNAGYLVIDCVYSLSLLLHWRL